MITHSLEYQYKRILFKGVSVMPESVMLFLIIILALAFDFVNGFHDTANAVATSVATRALSPSSAILLASTLNFIGALMFSGVAQTIGQGITSPVLLEQGLPVIMAALLASITWNLFTWYFGLPSSSSHALIGSLAGAVTAAAGWHAVNVEGLLKMLQALLLSPLLAVVAAMVLMTICRFGTSFLNQSKTDQVFKKLQVITAAMQAFSHGTNDAQKTMGVIVFALITVGWQQDFTIPLWVKFSAALAMALGTSLGGWRIINTVGQRITRIHPRNGFVADFSSASVIISATLLKLPVSTTHVISSSIVGVGLAGGKGYVNWRTVICIITAWLTTLPTSFLFSMFIYWVLNN
jgi:PiT family inorganic phosphate transporter